MEVEGRIGAERGRDRDARLHEQAHDVAEQTVDPFAHYDILRLHAVLRGERLLQIVIFRIAIFPGIGGLRPHGLDRARRRPEHAFIGADARAEKPAALTLLRFRPDEGHGRGQVLDDVGIRRERHAGFLILEDFIDHCTDGAVNRQTLGGSLRLPEVWGNVSRDPDNRERTGIWPRPFW